MMILITGGTGLVATAQVRYFVAKGHHVVITYRSDDKLSRFDESDRLTAIKVPDLLAPDAVLALCAELEAQNLFPDCLVNCAADTRWHRMEHDGHVTEECFINQYRMNVVVPYELSWRLATAPGSRLKKIVNISSMYGIVPYNPNLYEYPDNETPLQYGIAKAAMLQLTKELAIRFRDKGIMVNSVSYGGVEGRASEAFKHRFAMVTPLKRMMMPEETIPAVDFLLNDESHYMTGQNIIVDGGRTVW